MKLILQIFVTCIHLHIVFSNDKWSYSEWYDKVWTKWKKNGYVQESKLSIIHQNYVVQKLRGKANF